MTFKILAYENTTLVNEDKRQMGEMLCDGFRKRRDWPARVTAGDEAQEHYKEARPNLNPLDIHTMSLSSSQHTGR